jgi:hypothetical protein
MDREPPSAPPPVPPIDNYDALGAREVMRGLLDLPPEALRRLRAYEVLHARRTQVLGAIGRALARSAPTDAASRTPVEQGVRRRR